MSRFVNDGTSDAPKLRVYLNLDNLVGLREDSIWPGLTGDARDEQLRADGFEGIQLTPDEAYLGACLFTGLDRINLPADADAIALKHTVRGDECITVHAGWGMEDDRDVFSLVEAILNASERHKLPIFIETHRATITQDIWRTVQIAKRFPEVRFNGDFSHYYCGQELVYGDWEAKLAFMDPIFARVGYIHGRIASPGCIQVPIDNDLHARPKEAHGTVNYLEHFKELWTRAMLGFLRIAQPGDVLIFAPELLSGANYYARLFPDKGGDLLEESDRYAQALLLKELSRACFGKAKRRLHGKDHSFSGVDSPL